MTVSYKQFTFNNVNISVNEYISGVHQVGHKSKGFYGTTYMMKVCNRRCAVKCIRIKDQQSFENTFQQTLKEYLLCKISSVLEAKPLIQPTLGFYIFVHYDCIEFGMQLCEITKGYTANA